MRTWFLRILMLCLVLAGIFGAYAALSGRVYLFKAVWYNFADIDDYKIFSNNAIAPGTAQPWVPAVRYNQVQMTDPLAGLLQDLSTVGLVVIKDDSLLYESYWDGYSDSSISGSFSMAKSITSLLMGAALKSGQIQSLDQPVGDFLPEFREGRKAKARIIDLLTMSSGSDWDESYINPFSVTTEIYYGSDAYKTATGVHIVHDPGTLFAYKSGDTQLLGLILEKATGESLSQFAAEKLWQPLGAEHQALWSTDHPGGNEKAYCCFNSNARDFARIGQLMLDSGRWKGQEIISQQYFRKSVSPCGIADRSGKPCHYYGLQWWIDPHLPSVFYARGILGQYIIVIPAKREVIVRLGKRTSMHRKDTVPQEVDSLVAWGMTL